MSRFEYLEPPDLACCALVSRSWAADTQGHLWYKVGQYGGLHWNRCNLSREAFHDRVWLICDLRIDKDNMGILPKLTTVDFTLLRQKMLTARELSGHIFLLNLFLEVVHRVSPSLEQFEIWDQAQISGNRVLIGALAKAYKLKLLVLSNLAVGDEALGDAFVLGMEIPLLYRLCFVSVARYRN